MEEFGAVSGEREIDALAGELAFAAGGEVAVFGGLAGGMVIEAEGFSAEGGGAAAPFGLGAGVGEGVVAEDAEVLDRGVGPRCRGGVVQVVCVVDGGPPPQGYFLRAKSSCG